MLLHSLPLMGFGQVRNDSNTCTYMQGQAFANNYRRPVIGYEQDIADLSRQDISSFFRKHYGPENLSVAIVGDVTAAQVESLAKKYFGDWERRGGKTTDKGSDISDAALANAPDGQMMLVKNGEPPPDSNKLWNSPPPPPRRAPTPSARPANLEDNHQMVLASQAGPAAHICYYRPESRPTGKSVAVSILCDIISGTRSSRAYKQLVSTGAPSDDVWK